ncbi:protocadherin-16-like [Pararge aegeria]|uniref:protocadherin-16-like n=1 Tax=Pararge aegeria TaxID=116150 RepID=UPI0019D315D8|nr:protocadherin-16-like [Pararge aegeria]
MAAPLLVLAALALSASPAGTQAIQDSRCYLMNGGAVESFFISEDTPVGSIIGTLSVNGDPSAVGGDISLHIQEKNAAVELAAGSKNITLRRALDREEKLGPSSVYVNVRCDRRHTADPSFVVPVSVRVWDVNDNAPAWRGAPYRARVSELAAPGARLLAAPAHDPDQPGPHATVRYSVLPGPASEYVGFQSELDSTVVVKRALDYETLRNFTVRLRAQDGGSPPRYNDTTLSVEVLDADDQNPQFTHEHYTAVVPDNAQDGTVLELSPGPVSAADRDLGINAPVYYSASGDGAALLRLDRDSGALAATPPLLQHALPVTVVLKATQVDNADRYALATVTVRRTAAAGPARAAAANAADAGVRFARRGYAVSVPEDAPPGSVLTALHTRSLHETPLQFYVSERSFLEQFAINGAGEVLLRKPLDYETTERYHYQVMVTDGNSNDTAWINITVQNVNEWEPRFRHAHYEFLLHELPPAGPARVGALHAFDGDRQDSVALHLSGPDAKALFVNAQGEVFVRAEALRALNASVLHVVATAVDSGSPPRQTSVPVSVRIPERLAQAQARPPLLAALACALALLALALLALLAHLCRLRRRRQVKDKSATVAVAPEKSATPAPAASLSAGSAAGGSGSLQSVSAGASSILAASTCSLDRDRAPDKPLDKPLNGSAARQSQRLPARGKVAPASPAPAPGALSDHLHGAAGRSGVAWPSATIPARVKQLSWDDAAPQDGDERRELAEATNAAVSDHMNLTVYF